MTSTPIQDYAAIGDCHSIALVSRGGSIDWLCWPRFDSPSIFGAMLDERAGHWRIAPTVPFRSERRYVGDTNVLETRFFVDGGSLRLIDFMPVASEEDKRKFLLADHEVLRIAQCDEGEVELEVDFAPRPDYGQRLPRIEITPNLGVRIALGASLLAFRSDVGLQANASGRITRRLRLRAGEAVHFSLTFESDWIAVLPPLGAWSRECLLRTIAWWEKWSSRVKYDGPCLDAVVRSALAVRLLLYAPSGAFVAAPTTSLPERLGGDLNWDYRFCWLRDASLTMRALLGLGFRSEAEAFLNWLVHSTRLSRPKLQVLYDVFGRNPSPERPLDHLSGYRNSKPVRIGNAASRQLQLDVHGEVIDAAAQFVRQGGDLDRETRRLLNGFGKYVCRNWQQPDEGIWEPRTGRRCHTHSRLLCWVALDRLLSLHESGRIRTENAAEFTRERDHIRRQIQERAWNPVIGSYVSTIDGSALDASSLLIAWYGFEDATSERMRRTYAWVKDRLGAGHGLFYRYRHEEPPAEGAFGVCGFWATEYLALGGGSAEEALATLQELVALGNDVGLFSEEIDPATGLALGNFPQAFTHLGLINAALSVQRRLEGRDPLVRGVPPQRPDVASAEVRR